MRRETNKGVFGVPKQLFRLVQNNLEYHQRRNNKYVVEPTTVPILYYGTSNTYSTIPTPSYIFPTPRPASTTVIFLDK
jgi:hypothetical protein